MPGLNDFPLFSDEITASFRRFGHLFVDWPHKAESKSYFPPKGGSRQPSVPFLSGLLTLQQLDSVGADRSACPPCPGYAFLLFQDESSVQALIDACIQEDGKLYLCVSSPTIKDKPVSWLICSPYLDHQALVHKLGELISFYVLVYAGPDPALEPE